jgi:hemerythrin-like metal-binding protein
MAITWDENLRLGHAAIDMQHMEIFSRINDLSDKLTEGADDIEIRNLLNYLSSYSNHHFFEEEKLMTQIHYYGIHKQKKQHAAFKQEIEELSQLLRKNVKQVELAHRIETTLFRYFVNHISDLDKELAEFIKFQNAQP